MKKLLIGLGAAVVVVLGVAGPASAHVTPSVTEAPAGSFQAITFRIGHGCEGDGGDTDKVEIQMPDGVATATPQALPGWEASVDDSGPVVVTFEGGPLPHDQYLEYGVALQLPDTPGEVAEFPVEVLAIFLHQQVGAEPGLDAEEVAVADGPAAIRPIGTVRSASIRPIRTTCTCRA